MAEQPPPKKIGSLRDRIAAFENKGSVPAPAQPPVPRPKPGNVQWKPRATSPPPAPAAAAAAATEEHADQRGPGMSAADAKESIRAGGSLKDRMAALQGRGAFGAPAPAAPPPRPASEKPKWKPPPVISPPAVDDDDEPEHTPAALPTSPPADVTAASEDAESAHAQPAEGGEEEAKEADPEDEERQRRAAIAARMARLGGARVGMAPPIFGKKPDVPPKKVDTPKVVEPKEEAAEPSADVHAAGKSTVACWTAWKADHAHQPLPCRARHRANLQRMCDLPMPKVIVDHNLRCHVYLPSTPRLRWR